MHPYQSPHKILRYLDDMKKDKDDGDEAVPEETKDGTRRG